MKKLVAVLLVVVSIVGLASISFAEEGINTKWKLYNDESKNSLLAVGAAWFVPSLGHAYAGDWGRSLPMVGTELVGFGLAMASIQGATLNTSMYSTGLLLFIGGRIWEYVDAFNTAEDFNKNLKKKYELGLNIFDNQPVLQLSYKF